MTTTLNLTINNKQLPDKATAAKSHKHSPAARLVYYGLILISLASLLVGLWWAYPKIDHGFRGLPDFVNLHWAHDALLLQTFLAMMGMLWFVVTLFFWCGWLIRRSWRKLHGKHWRIHKKGLSRFAELFPPVLIYLRASCYYLAIVLLYVILQYPIQFIIFK